MADEWLQETGGTDAWLMESGGADAWLLEDAGGAAPATPKRLLLLGVGSILLAVTTLLLLW